MSSFPYAHYAVENNKSTRTKKFCCRVSEFTPNNSFCTLYYPRGRSTWIQFKRQAHGMHFSQIPESAAPRIKLSSTLNLFSTSRAKVCEMPTLNLAAILYFYHLKKTTKNSFSSSFEERQFIQRRSRAMIQVSKPRLRI